MSISVAFQSAVFYFIACTPCAKVRHRQKARQKAKKEREDKARIEIEQPGLYRHPSPFNTNPYWGEEIMMGPSLPKKGKAGLDANNKANSQRGLTTAGQDSGIGTRSSLAISHAGTTTSSTTAKTLTNPPPSQSPESEPMVVASSSEEPTSPTLTQTASISTGGDWNYKRYQREDEELWGHELSRTGHKLMDAIKQAGTSAGRFMEAKLGKEKPVTDEDRVNFYFTPRNPPVNDYHPPVVSSKPAHRDGHRWMLQPPPPAKVMEGRIPVSRSTSLASMASSRRTAATGDGATLSRLVGERAVEAKIRKGETPTDVRSVSTSTLPKPLTRRTTAGSSARSRSQRTVRSRSHSLSTESEPEAVAEGMGQTRRKPRVRPPLATAELESDDEDEWISRSLESFSHPNIPSHTSHAAQRPRLSTILSSEQAKTIPGRESRDTAMPLRNITNMTGNPFTTAGNDDGPKERAAGASTDSGLALHA